METISIAAKPRSQTGSHAVNKLRNDGKVPGVVYGHQFSDPLPIVIEARDLRSALSGHNINSVFTLEIEGRGATPVMVHERQHDIISHHLIHIDLTIRSSVLYSFQLRVLLKRAEKARRTLQDRIDELRKTQNSSLGNSTT